MSLLAGDHRPRRRATTYYYCAIASNSVRHRASARCCRSPRPAAADGDHRRGDARSRGHGDAQRLGEPQRRGDHRLVPLRHRPAPAPATTRFGTRAPVERRHRRSARARVAVAYSAGDRRPRARRRRTTSAPSPRTRAASASARCCRSPPPAPPTVTTAAATAIDGDHGDAQRLRRTPTATRPPAGSATATTSPGTCNDTLRHARPGERRLRRSARAPRRWPTRQAITGLPPATTYYFCAIAAERRAAPRSARCCRSPPPARADGDHRRAATLSPATHGDAQRLGQPERRRDHRLVPLQHRRARAPATTRFGTRAPAERRHRRSAPAARR